MFVSGWYIVYSLVVDTIVDAVSATVSVIQGTQ